MFIDRKIDLKGDIFFGDAEAQIHLEPIVALPLVC